MNRRMTIEKLKEMVKLFEQGYRVSQVARELGFAPRTIDIWVRKCKLAGVKINNPKGPKPLDLNELR